MNIEDFLFKNGYWILGKGQKDEAPTIITTAKWGKMITILFKNKPYDMITEEDVWNYVRDLS